MCPCQSLIGCKGSPVLAEEKVKWAFVLHFRNASKWWSEINTQKPQFNSFVPKREADVGGRMGLRLWAFLVTNPTDEPITSGFRHSGMNHNYRSGRPDIPKTILRAPIVSGS